MILLKSLTAILKLFVVDSKGMRITKVFAKAWQTEEKSTEDHYCTASGLDGTLLNF